MEEKLITVVVLPFSKAHILKMLLEAKNIECQLEDVHVIQGATSTTVRVKILEKDIPIVVKELENFLGSKSASIPTKEEPLPAKQVLVPIDFSSASVTAGKLAFGIAAHLKADLVLMHCYINPIIHSMPYGDVFAFDTSALYRLEDAEKKAQDSFQAFIDILKEKIGKEEWEKVNSEIIIKSGYPEEDILAYARKNRPRLVVLGSGGESYPNGIVGSVTVDIMYNANVPVLVIPKDAPEKEVAEYTHVVYATNFDEKDFEALDKLSGILAPFDIRLTCVHVGEPRRNGWDLAKLEGMKELLQKKYADKNFKCLLLVGNDVLDSLEEFIRSSDVDLLSLTTHKRGMISRLFNPSLARKMMFHTQTPLLIFHS